MRRSFAVELVVVGSALCASAQPGATPAQVGAMTVQRYATVLNLTSSQQEQAVSIFTTQETVEVPIRKSERLAREVLQAAVRANNIASITDTSTMLGELSGQDTRARALAEAQLYAILTQEQQARYTQLKSQDEGQRGPRIGGPGGPPPR